MVAILQPNAKTRKTVPTVKGIDGYSNFKYVGDGLMRVHKAYSVGEGRLVQIKGSQYFVPLNPILEKEEHDFTSTDGTKMTQYEQQRTPNMTLARLCPQRNCTGIVIPGEPHEHQIGQLSAEDVKGIDRYKVQWGEELLGENSGLHGKSVYEVCLLSKEISFNCH